MTYTPPFKITPLILTHCQSIGRELGSLVSAKQEVAPVKLRRVNAIKTIQASLAIEGNTLGVDQVTHLFDGKRVMGPEKDILEVYNAIKVYERLADWDPLLAEDCLKAHGLLMKGLVLDAGHWRLGSVGVFKGGNITHMAPPAKRVSCLMSDLFAFTGQSDLSWLLKACIFHYEFEFIHPFSDGNGRMGRLWQQLLLMKEDPVFQYIPIETLIQEHQEAYYHVLGQCDQAGDSTAFIEFCLKKIGIALAQYRYSASPIHQDASSRLSYAKAKLQGQWFSRKNYIKIQGDFSTATASRDLQQGVQQGILEKKGEMNQVTYRFIEEGSGIIS
jgi:Fic family protein